MNEIERTLRRTASTPDTKFDQQKIGGLKLELRQILGVLGATATLPDDNAVVESATKVVEDGLHGPVVASAAESGASSYVVAAPRCLRQST